jgi:transposase-like protein
MSKRKHYSPEYKREFVELVRRSQSSCRRIALEVGGNPNMLIRWVREANAVFLQANTRTTELTDVAVD